MKRGRSFRRTFLTACAAAMSALLAASPLAPTPAASGAGQPPPQQPAQAAQQPGVRVVTLPVIRRTHATPAAPGRTGLVKRAPIQFKPIPMIHPTTGKPLNPNAIMTLPTGKKVTVKSFYDQVNKVEQLLNAQGYSLRQAGQLKAGRQAALNQSKLGPQQSGPFAAKALTAQQLAQRRERQKAELAQSATSMSQKFEDDLKASVDAKMGRGSGSSGGHGSAGGGGMTMTGGNGSAGGGGKPGGGSGGAPAGTQTDTLGKSFNWRFPFQNDYFNVYLRGDFRLDRQRTSAGVTGVRAVGRANAGAELFNPERLFDAGAANIDVPFAALRLELSAGGMSLLEHGVPVYRELSLNSVGMPTADPQGGAYPLSYKFEQPYVHHEQKTFILFGFLPVTLTFDLNGNVILLVNLTALKQGITGGLNTHCYLNTSGSAVAGMPDIAWAGVELNMTLLDDKVNVYVNTFQFGPNRIPLEGDHQFAALKGGLRLTAGFAHPCLDPAEQVKKIGESIWAAVSGEDVPVPLCKTEDAYNIWSSPGYANSEALF